jgi:hypothetical protein
MYPIDQGLDAIGSDVAVEAVEFRGGRFTVME